ncbi:sortilin-like [Meleagris gallopavo]|uniref:sortilin-like n=1 Tax=Meleagris gallopavo TaxID=9103 RepID=UPI000549BA48|nr:sortilin-like [Meleagris gallopavo]
MGSPRHYGLPVVPGSSAWLCGIPTFLSPPRFLVHRYSVLRQHAEASGAEGPETADSPSPPYEGGYHDDSDEDLLE